MVLAALIIRRAAHLTLRSFITFCTTPSNLASSFALKGIFGSQRALCFARSGAKQAV